jgi:hypothetical protein
MADDDVIIDELDAEPIVTNNPIADFLKSVENQEFTDAERQFNDMVSDRLQTQLDQAKLAIASSIYGDEEVSDVMDELEDDDETDDDETDDDLTDDDV